MAEKQKDVIGKLRHDIHDAWSDGNMTEDIHDSTLAHLDRLEAAEPDWERWMDWDKAPQTARAARIAVHFAGQLSDDKGCAWWYELARQRRPVPALKPGDRVRWYKGKDNGTGNYERDYGIPSAPFSHLVQIGGVPQSLWVERVEPLTKEDDS